MYFLHIWFNMSDEAVEDLIYDSHAMRSFMRVSFGGEQAPDATTLLKFRHPLEEDKLGEKRSAGSVKPHMRIRPGFSAFFPEHL
jgi:IS5 family transposase